MYVLCCAEDTVTYLNNVEYPVKNHSKWRVSESLILYISLPFSAGILFLFFPFAAYWLTIFVLLGLSPFIPKNLRIFLGIIAVLSGSATYASRIFGFFGSDDFVSYYATYSGLYHGDMTRLFDYGGGIEIGLPVIDLALVWIFPELSPNGLMFFTSVLWGIIFILLIEKYLLTSVVAGKRATIVGLSLLLYSFFLSTQLSRQWFASLLVLAALLQTHKKAFAGYGLAAFFIHMSSVPMLFVYRILLFGKPWMLLVVALTAIFLSVYQDIVSDMVLFHLTQEDIGRVSIFARKDDEVSANIGTIGKMFLPILAIAVSWLWSALASKQLAQYSLYPIETKKWMIFYLSVFFLYLGMLDFYSLPHRLFLMVHGLMLGYFFALFMSRLPKAFFISGSLLFAVWNLSYYMFRFDWDSVNAPGKVYPLFDTLPCYFLSSYFR